MLTTFFKIRENLFVSPAKRDKIILSGLLASLTLNILTWLALIMIFSGVSEYVILRYNMYFGISALGPWSALLLVPLLALILTLVDFLLAFYFYIRYLILSYFLVTAATLVNAIALLAVLLLIFANW